MVHWRDFFSSEIEIDPSVEVFIKRVVFYCLHSNQYIEVEQPVETIFIKNVGNALNILSHKHGIQIQRLINRYPLARATIALHLEYLYIHLKFFYERCYPRFVRPMTYLLVLSLAMEVIYVIWSRFPQDEKREFTYATVYILSRLFSGREFTTRCSIQSITYYASHIVVGFEGVLRYLRSHPRRPYLYQPRIPVNYLDNVPRPEDLFSPENPVSDPSWSDSGVSTTSPVHGSTPSTPLSPSEPSIPELEQPGCMPSFRRFIPQIFRIRCDQPILARFRLFSRFRRFCRELPRPFE